MKKFIISIIMLSLTSFAYAVSTDEYNRQGLGALDRVDYKAASLAFKKACDGGYETACPYLYKNKN